MRLPPTQTGYSPMCPKPSLPARPMPGYYYPGMPYRQGEEELQQQVTYAPNYNYHSSNPWISQGGGGYWQSNYIPQTHYSQSYTPYSSSNKNATSWSQTWAEEQLEKALEQKKQDTRKLAEKKLQAKSMADRAKLQKASPKPFIPSSKVAKGSPSSRGGFGPSGGSHAASAAA